MIVEENTEVIVENFNLIDKIYIKVLDGFMLEMLISWMS